MNKLSIITFAAAAMAVVAPTAHAEDAYIESDGTQFINTGYYVKPTSRVELDFAFVDFADTTAYVQTRLFDNNPSVQTPSLAASVYVGGTAGTSNYSLAGCIGDCGSFSGVWTSNSGTGTKSAYCDSSKRTIVLDELNKRIAIEANGVEVWYNDQSSARTFNNTASWPLGLFGRTTTNATGNNCDCLSRIRVYGFRIYEDEELVHDYLPVVKGGIAGLLDTVTGTFLYDTRISGKAFAYGGDIETIDDDPYIASDGTGVINLGVSASPKLHIEVDYALLDGNAVQARLFGEDTVTSTPRISIYINGSGKMAIASGDGWNAVDTGIVTNTARHKIVIDNVALCRALMTGVTTNKVSSTAADLTKCATRPFGLFGNLADDAGTSSSGRIKAKVYGLKIWSGGTLIRDLEPRNINGTAGFEDLVTGRFYTCDGLTASANAATELSGASRDGDAFVESDGSFYSVVNTYYFVKPTTKIEIDYALAAIVSGAGVLGGYGASAGISTILWCNSTTKLILEMRDGNHDSTANNLFSPDIPLDLARHTAVFDGPGRHLSLSSHDGTVEAESDFYESWTLNTAQANWPVLLFGFATDVYGHNQQRSKSRIYSVKFYESGSLVLSLTPAVKGGVAGFKDGAGNFYSGDGLIAGGAVETIDEDPYVENPDGGRFFDTGYYVTSNTCIKVDYMPLVQQNTQQFPFEAGTAVTATNDSKQMYMRTYGNGSAGTGDIAYACGGQLFISTSVPYAPHVRRQLTLDAYNLKCKIETAGVLVREMTIGTIGCSAQSSTTLKLLSNGNMNANSCKARLYGIQIYEEGTLVRDYVPICQAGSYALLDKVQGKVLAKASNSKEFTGYTSNNDLDDAFFTAPMRAEDAYIESDGTQGINLGYLTTPNTRYEIDYALTAIVGQNRPFGEAGGDLSAELYIQGEATGSGNVAFGVGETWKGQYTSMGADLNRHLAVLDLANHQCGYSGKGMFKFGTDVTTKKTATNLMWLFAKGTNASGAHADNSRTAMKLYAFRIFESGTLVHEYLPYKVGSTVGLYDTMTGDVITSSVSGSNAFTYGGGLGYGKFAGELKSLVVTPENVSLARGNSKTVTAYAPGAVRYVWRKNGEVLGGEDGESLTIVWGRRKLANSVDSYTVAPVFTVGGNDVEGDTAAFTVANQPLGTRIILR